MGQLVLVVDDRPTTVQLVEDALVAEGYSVVSAENGAQCLRTIAEARPDLVILDINMPIMDGFEVLRSIRLKEATRDLPVIVLSVRTSDQDRFEGRLRGANEYLPKPCRMTDLVAAVRRVLAEKPAAAEPRSEE